MCRQNKDKFFIADNYRNTHMVFRNKKKLSNKNVNFVQRTNVQKYKRKATIKRKRRTKWQRKCQVICDKKKKLKKRGKSGKLPLIFHQKPNNIVVFGIGLEL